MKNSFKTKIQNFKNVSFKNKKVAPGSGVKNFIALTLFMFLGHFIFAQTVDGQLITWGGTIRTALNVVVSIFAIVGGLLVFIQYMQGNESAQKNLIRFVIGLAVFGLAGLIVTALIPTAPVV